MLGNVSTITGNFTDLITPIIGGNGSLNLEDGGFLSAKLIAEFGVIGIAIVISYIIQIFKILFKIRKLNQKIELDDMEKKQLILYGFIFSFLVEMFLRGYGYFSPCLLIVLTAYFSLLRIEKIINKRRPLNCL